MLIAYRGACQSSVQAIWGPWIGRRCAFERHRMPGKIEGKRWRSVRQTTSRNWNVPISSEFIRQKTSARGSLMPSSDLGWPSGISAPQQTPFSAQDPVPSPGGPPAAGVLSFSHRLGHGVQSGSSRLTRIVPSEDGGLAMICGDRMPNRQCGSLFLVLQQCFVRGNELANIG
jgi:hypothetical protein